MVGDHADFGPDAPTAEMKQKGTVLFEDNYQ